MKHNIVKLAKENDLGAVKIKEYRIIYLRWSKKRGSASFGVVNRKPQKAKLRAHPENRPVICNVFELSLFKFKKSTSIFCMLVNEGARKSYMKSLESMNGYHLRSQLYESSTKSTFKLLSNGNLCIAYRKKNNHGLSIGVCDKSLNQLFQSYVESSINQRFQLVEMKEFVYFFSSNAKSILCRIIKYDYDLNTLVHMIFNFELNYADVHEDELYLLATSPDGNSRHIHVFDESLSKNIQLSSSEDLPFYVPDSVAKMKISEKYFLFLDGTKVLLMDRLDGMIKRTLSIGRNDFVLDSSNDRVMAYDAKTEKLVCFDFEGESFEISLASMKNFELVDFVHDGFMFYDPNSLCLHFQVRALDKKNSDSII